MASGLVGVDTQALIGHSFARLGVRPLGLACAILILAIALGDARSLRSSGLCMVHSVGLCLTQFLLECRSYLQRKSSVPRPQGPQRATVCQQMCLTF